MVVNLDKVVETLLRLQEVEEDGLRRFFFEGQVHVLSTIYDYLYLNVLYLIA